MKRRLRRGLSILITLSMMMTFMPGGIRTVYASDADTRSTILDLTVGTVQYHTSSGLDGNANPKTTDITNTTEGWSWNYQSKTLTLDGIDLITSESTALKLPANSTIVLAEDSDNTVTSTYNSDVITEADCFGIYCGGTLTVEGAGTLNVQSGNTADAFSLAIYTPANLTISGGTINATGGAASSSSIGLYCLGTMSITDGTITAAGASDIESSYGISSGGNLSIADGIINASGGDDTQYSIGICTTGDLSITGGTVTADGGVNAEKFSYGILVSEDIKKATTTFSGGTVYASGGSSENSVGICGAGDISVTAGTVTATGNPATKVSYGIVVTAGSAIFSGGIVYAKANAPLPYAVYATLGITDADVTVLQKDSESTYSHQVAKKNVENVFTYLTDQGTMATDIRITEGRAVVSNKMVAGMMGRALLGTDLVTVTLAGSSFTNLSQGDVVSDWFNNLPEGLSVTVSKITADTAELVFLGTPSTVSDETISITIPKGKLNTDSDIKVIKNSATHFDITQEEPRKTILDLTANNVIYQKEGGGTGSGNPASSNIINTAEGWRWYKNAEGSYSENTLVLDGISLITANQTAIRLPDNSTIVLADDSENTVESNFEGVIGTSGISCMGALRMQGSTGSLRVTSGTSENSYSAAFDVTGSLSILGGSITANSRNAHGSSMGIYVGGPVHISGGHITATGDNATSSYGIRSLSTMTVTGGTVTAMGSTAAGGSYGIFAMNTATFSDGVVYAKSGAAPLTHAVYAATGITDTGMTVFQKDSEGGYKIALSKTAMNYRYDENAATDIKIVQTPASYMLTVQGGGDSATENGDYVAGTVVSINAGIKTGYTFSGWTTSGEGVFDNSSLPNTTFTMPDSDVTITATWTVVPQHGGGSKRDKNQSQSQENSKVIINGKAISAGTVKTEIDSDGRTTTTFSVDAEKLHSILNSEKNGAKVVIPFKDIDKGAVGRLTGEMVQAMEGKNATLIIQTGASSYMLPASQINIKAVSKQLGTGVSLADIAVSVSISAPSNTMAKVAENASEEGSFEIVAPVVDYKVTCTYGSKTVNVTSFNAYVERTIAVPDGVNPSKITTGILVSPDGTVHHVPTRVTIIDGKYYAVISSLTNSTYSIIWNPVTFSDVETHWAKDSVNNMGSRMVVSGVANNKFEPNRGTTRAEFAAIIIRALGLEPGIDTSRFKDVRVSDWYFESIQTAVSFGIIKGYNEETFAPNDTITREQAMTMIARAMKITGLNAELANGEDSKLLEVFSDRAGVSAYAKDSIAKCIKTEVASGRENNTLAPKAYVTRAEVAAMAERLLQKSDLI